MKTVSGKFNFKELMELDLLYSGKTRDFQLVYKGKLKNFNLIVTIPVSEIKTHKVIFKLKEVTNIIHEIQIEGEIWNQ